MLIKLNDSRKFMGFSTFVGLSESFKPKETDFGTDGKNGEWSHSVRDHVHTFINHTHDHHVLVALHKHTGEVAFATHRGNFTDDIHHHYDMEKTHTGDALTVMNKVFHVALIGAKQHGLDKLKFHGGTEDLKHTYEMAVKNKHLQHHLGEHGFEYVGSEDGVHHFARKRLT